MSDLPRTNELNDLVDPDAVWAWPDGHLHPTPPLPVARLWFTEAGLAAPLPVWWVDVEAEPCGAEAFVRETTDGQERRFLCDRLKGHTDLDVGKLEQHRCVTDNARGDAVIWKPGEAGPPAELWRGAGAS